jgi:hypothetical protein
LRGEVPAREEFAGRAAEDEQVEQRVRAQTIGAVHRYARAFADRVQALHGRLRVRAGSQRAHDLAVHVGRTPPIM